MSTTGGALAEAQNFFQAEWGEEPAFQLQVAKPNPECDTDDADDDRQWRDSKRKLPIAGQDEEHRAREPGKASHRPAEEIGCRHGAGPLSGDRDHTEIFHGVFQSP